MKKKILVFLFAVLLVASNMIPAASAFDIIYDLPPISAKLSEGNQVVTVTFETAPNPGEYIMVYSAWDAFRINEPVAIHTIENHALVQKVRLDEPAQANVFVSYAPLHTSEGGQVESRTIESTGYAASSSGSSGNDITSSPPGSSDNSVAQTGLTTDFASLPIYDVSSKTYPLGDTNAKLTVLVVGRVTCGLTTGKLQRVKTLFTQLGISDAKIYLLDIDNTKDTSQAYAEQHPDIQIAWNNNSRDYDKLFWEIQHASNAVVNGSAVLPSLCVLDGALQPVYYAAGTGIDFSELEKVLSPYGILPKNESGGNDHSADASHNASGGGETPSSGALPGADETSEDALRKRLLEMGVEDVEKALAALQNGGTYSKQHVTISSISPGSDSTSGNIPENIPVEELHTDFSKLPVYDVVNGEYLLSSKDSDLSILIIGNPLCSYTVKRVQFVKAMLEALNVKNARLYLLDMGTEVGSAPADAEHFAKKKPGVFVARAAGNNDIYYRLFFEVCRTKGKPGGRFPAICVLDSKCNPIYTTTEILFDENELSEILRPYATVSHNEAKDAPFLDVQPDAYYYDAVEWAMDQNITAGTTASTFSPNDTCTQAQIITFLYRAVGSPALIGKNVYTNSAVTSKQYYYQAMLWAYQNGIVTDADLNPNNDCTRSDVVTYLWRLAGKPSAGSSAFSDVPASADYAQAVAWAVQQGITAGTSKTTFSPNVTCTRGQIVTFLYRNMA